MDITTVCQPVIKVTDLHPEGAIFARGACGDKGQMYMHVKAMEYMTRTGNLPCNVKFMIEGEEEVGSSSLSWFVERNHLNPYRYLQPPLQAGHAVGGVAHYEPPARDRAGRV